MKEIKVIGRGGQGGKTAAEIIAKINLNKGKFIQSFPEYGAERQGAPVFAYARIDEKPIRLYCNIKNPDIIIIIDPTLIKNDMIEGIKEDSILIANTPHTPDEIRQKLNLSSQKIYTIDATAISIKYLGKNIPNTPILGAFAKATDIFTVKDIEEEIRHKFEKKIGPEMTQKNIDSIKEAFEGVKK